MNGVPLVGMRVKVTIGPKTFSGAVERVRLHPKHGFEVRIQLDPDGPVPGGILKRAWKDCEAAS